MRQTHSPHTTTNPRNRFSETVDQLAALTFLLPLALFIFSLVLLPILGTVAGSLFRDLPYLPKRFIGLHNYVWLFQDPGFWQALRFTTLFAAVTVPLEVTLGLLIALVLNERIPLRGVLRACVLIPWAIPAAVSGRIFELVYNYSFGAANCLLQRLHLTEAPINWLGNELSAFGALVCADIWKTTPFVAIIVLAGLATIPQDLYRQAQIDRATFFQRFTRITLPLLKPVIAVAVLLRTIDALRIFDIVYVLTNGGPGGTTTPLSLFGYAHFTAGDFGYGSAVSVVIFLLAFGICLGVLASARLERQW
jgi:multiple sugar transport system permease protein